MGFFRTRAKYALNYVADQVTLRVTSRVSDQVTRNIIQAFPNIVKNSIPSYPLTPKATPLVITPDATHFYIHTSDGHRFFLDASDHHISLHVMEHGHWEDHVRDVMMQILKPGSVFIDVGGNVGLHTLFAGSIVGESGKVFTYEPLPQMFKTLKLNIDVNGMGGIITPHQMAVSDAEGIQSFSNFRSHSAMSGFTVPQSRLDQFNETDSSVEVIEVQTTTLDKSFSGQRIDAIKIDVEGYEALVIRGAQSLIKENKDIKLIIEWDPPLVEKTIGYDSMAQMIEFFQSEGFTPYLALWRQPLKEVTWEETPSLRGDLVLSRSAILH
ncbi:FkbM family methyltransferase [Neorhizobium sp. T786]|uniref:FkbM family methyltransferase n=1 Tax=Pseudorhizobium xiangyangii TaxID=2883104 RepID=UPI001CFF7EF1|nr:FkbM family methyltransferase [Neorhizobium xiangyangii]MCB5202612.1 FkbM family methyltransferase [Neorhizobium xiangyangii]